MFRIWPQDFLFSPFICQSNGQPILFPLATEDEQLERCGLWQLQDELQMRGKWNRSPRLILPTLQAVCQLLQQGPGQSTLFLNCDICLTQWAHFSTQTLLGASSTIKFFLSEAVLGQHFYEVELKEGEPQPGDLFLFKLHSPKAQWCGTHVGVYCGHGEIIHFEGRNPSSGLQTLLASCEGVVCKQGHRALQHSRQLWRVLRRRSGVDPIVLQCRIREAMKPTHLPITLHAATVCTLHCASWA